MRIGFDAKRAYFNYSGLGNYSRNTIRQLSTHFPENDYYLYVPRKRNQITNGTYPNHTLVYPRSWKTRNLSSFWRSYWLGKQLLRDGLDLYHGLSNEIPFDMPGQRVPSVVTIHDLIFLRFPEWYPPIDRKIYSRKAAFACSHADRIVAISRQTRSDIIQYLGTPEEKIDVVYQGCDPGFCREWTGSEKLEIIRKYQLPDTYLLYVGTIEPRKNLLQVIKSLHLGKLDVPLIVIGRTTPYIKQIRQYMAEHSLKHIVFLQDIPNDDLPGIYQQAGAFIYPSRFEGFGIPILEALFSRTPVITSRGSCFDEAGGPSSIYVDPDNTEEMADAIKRLLESVDLRAEMKEKGYEHARKFTDEIIANNLMEVYRKVL
jgi:glycosyltransferase involved in cell wall biosynthesis